MFPGQLESLTPEASTQEMTMFDTHEFVTTLKSAGMSEEQATLTLKAFSTAINTTTEEFVKTDALTDLKLAMIEMRADITKQLSDMNVKLADVKSETADIKNVRLITVTTLSLTVSILIAAIAAVAKQLL
jgi:hypothetical protein